MLPPRAYPFIGLNIVRALSIIGLLLVFSSSIFVMVQDVRAVNNFTEQKQSGSANSTSLAEMLRCDYIMNSTVPNQPAGVFWAILNRLLVIFQVIALILSELGWPYAFFDKYFPVLGSAFGMGALGVMQCLIGAAVLSHHVDDFALVSAFFLFSIGCLNILIGLIYREKAKSKRSLTSWKDRAEDFLPPPVTTGIKVARRAFSEKGGYGDFEGSHAGLGFGRQGEKAALGKGYFVNRPDASLPRYAPKPSPAATEDPEAQTTHSRESSVSTKNEQQ